MGTSVITRSGLSFGVRFHQKSAEIGNQRINFFRFLLPPGNDFFIQWVGSRQTAQGCRRREINGKIYFQAVRTEYIRQYFYFLQILIGKNLGTCVDIIQYGCVDADRGIGTGISFVTGRDNGRKLFPFPKRMSRITTLDGSIQIIPVVQDTNPVIRFLRDIQYLQF